MLFFLNGQELFETNKNNAKRRWATIKQIINLKNKYTEGYRKFMLIEEPETIAENFNEFFIHIGSHLADKIPKVNDTPEQYLKGSYMQSFFSYLLMSKKSSLQ